MTPHGPQAKVSTLAWLSRPFLSWPLLAHQTHHLFKHLYSAHIKNTHCSLSTLHSLLHACAHTYSLSGETSHPSKPRSKAISSSSSPSSSSESLYVPPSRSILAFGVLSYNVLTDHSVSLTALWVLLRVGTFSNSLMHHSSELVCMWRE